MKALIDDARAMMNEEREDLVRDCVDPAVPTTVTLPHTDWLRLLGAVWDALQLQQPEAFQADVTWELLQAVADKVFAEGSPEVRHLRTNPDPRGMLTWCLADAEMVEASMEIELHSGYRWNPFDGSYATLTISDVANALAKTRAGGLFLGHPYSLAQRSCLLAKMVPSSHRRLALLCQVPGALLGELSPPLLQHPCMAFLVDLQNAVMVKLMRRFGVPELDHQPIRAALRRVRGYEDWTYRRKPHAELQLMTGEKGDQLEKDLVAVSPMDAYADWLAAWNLAVKEVPAS